MGLDPKEILNNSSAIFAKIKTKEDIIVHGLPDELKRFLGSPQCLSQGRFDTSEQFQYRTALSADGNLFQMLARLRYGLIIIGCIVVRRELISELDYSDWIAPNELKSILVDPHFQKR